MTRTKICGIQKTEDALIAAEAGADFIGLVFVPKRRRRLEIGAAAEIVDNLRAAMPQPPRVVGLFADQPLVEVSRVIEYAGLDMVQLCGKESPGYCRQVLAKTGAGVIKVQHVSGQGSGDATYGKEDDTLEDQLLRYREAGCYITLDRLVEGLQGGTGQSFDWDIATQLSRKGYEFLLAGGLTPANVAQAVAQVRPWGVDVSSGVETDGANDPKKIRAFIQNARSAA